MKKYKTVHENEVFINPPKGKVLTIKEVMEARSSKYEFIDFEEEESLIDDYYTASDILDGCSQETLKEAAENLFGKLETGVGADRRKIWINGAKWNQEQDKILLDRYNQYTIDCIEVELRRPLSFYEWIKQEKLWKE